jgi:hypothetical protein
MLSPEIRVIIKILCYRGVGGCGNRLHVFQISITFQVMGGLFRPLSLRLWICS